MKHPNVALTAAAFVAVTLSLGGVDAGSSSTLIEGDGMIHCLLDIVGAFQVPCEIVSVNPFHLRGADHPTLQTGATEGVTLTIAWNAETPAATRLNAFMHGNPDCSAITQDANCSVSSVGGESPLILSLPPSAASHFELVASIQLGGGCHWVRGPVNPTVLPTSCDVPPASIVIDQPFHYTWEIR